MRKLFTGLAIPQQYVCISLEDFQYPLTVYLSVGGSELSIDVTHKHLFLGYSPLIIAAVLPEGYDSIDSEETVTLNFVHDGSLFHSVPAKKCLAKLDLKRIRSKKIGGEDVIFYEGYYGAHCFINDFHQSINNFREKIRKKTPNNVALPGNLYDQVRIAYSVPRIIKVVTVSDDSRMNMFPTDLHGPCGTAFYLSSLRHGGKANKQVVHSGKLLLSSIAAEDYKAVYGLGKNHMRDMRPFKDFALLEERSAHFNLPIPSAALQYKELECLDSFDVGIHRIHIYHVVRSEHIRSGNTLAHIHQYYAQWRIDHSVPLTMLLR